MNEKALEGPDWLATFKTLPLVLSAKFLIWTHVCSVRFTSDGLGRRRGDTIQVVLAVLCVQPRHHFCTALYQHLPVLNCQHPHTRPLRGNHRLKSIPHCNGRCSPSLFPAHVTRVWCCGISSQWQGSRCIIGLGFINPSEIDPSVSPMILTHLQNLFLRELYCTLRRPPRRSFVTHKKIKLMEHQEAKSSHTELSTPNVRYCPAYSMPEPGSLTDRLTIDVFNSEPL